MKKDRPVFCEYCGGDKLWGAPAWIIESGKSFCSLYCKQDYRALMRRLWRKGKLSSTTPLQFV